MCIRDRLNMMQDYDIVGLQLIVDPPSENVDVGNTDAVVASTKRWTFGTFTFTGKTGYTLHVRGAENDENNGDFVISSVVSAHVAATAGAGTLIDETFDPDTVNALSLI